MGFHSKDFTQSSYETLTLPGMYLNVLVPRLEEAQGVGLLCRKGCWSDFPRTFQQQDDIRTLSGHLHWGTGLYRNHSKSRWWHRKRNLLSQKKRQERRMCKRSGLGPLSRYVTIMSEDYQHLSMDSYRWCRTSLWLDSRTGPWLLPGEGRWPNTTRSS